MLRVGFHLRGIPLQPQQHQKLVSDLVVEVAQSLSSVALPGGSSLPIHLTENLPLGYNTCTMHGHQRTLVYRLGMAVNAFVCLGLLLQLSTLTMSH
jgi:hypothetical protein